MKLHYDPTSTTSRPVLIFLHEAGMEVTLKPLSLFGGDHLAPTFAALNPNRAVPVLEDGDFVLTEVSAILKFLAEGHASYPSEPHARAKVHQWMDWFNIGFYRDHGYGLVYSQIIPDYRHANPITQADIIERAAERSARWLGILDLALGETPFLCGEAPTIADFLGVSYVTLGDWIGFDLSYWPQVRRWVAAMRARPSWTDTHDAWNSMVAMLRQPEPA